MSIRHELTPYLAEVGGHLGFAVRPGFRRRGYATQMLRLSLGVAAVAGPDRVLITCDPDNMGAGAVIERCGGEFDQVKGGKRHYWVNASEA